MTPRARYTTAMHPGSILHSVREQYLKHFLREAGILADFGPGDVLAESYFSQVTGKDINRGLLDVPGRGDLFLVRSGDVVKSVIVETNKMPMFKPFEFTWEDDLHVTMSPFQWNWLCIRLSDLGPEPNWPMLRDWFMEWFEPDTDGPSPEGLLGVVHFISNPTAQPNDAFTLAIDLGSAPVVAVEALFDRLIDMGARELEVGQFPVTP